MSLHSNKEIDVPLTQEEIDAIWQVRNELSLRRRGSEIQDGFEEYQQLKDALQDNRITIDEEKTQALSEKAEKLKNEPACFERRESLAEQVGSTLKNSIENVAPHQKAIVGVVTAGALLASWQGDYKSLAFFAATGIGVLISKPMMVSAPYKSAMHHVDRFFGHANQQGNNTNSSVTENKMKV